MDYFGSENIDQENRPDSLKIEMNFSLFFFFLPENVSRFLAIVFLVSHILCLVSELFF